MDMFDRLNRETNRYNATKVTRNIGTSSTPKYGTADYWVNYWNNQTYKANNNQYSNYYTYR